MYEDGEGSEDSEDSVAFGGILTVDCVVALGSILVISEEVSVIGGMVLPVGASVVAIGGGLVLPEGASVVRAVAGYGADLSR